MTAIAAILAYAMLGLGFFFIFTGVIGILRFPDFYTRLHAMGKCDTLGVALMLLGLVMLHGLTHESFKMLLAIAFVAVANPTATHALGRAAYRVGLAPWTKANGSDGRES